MNVSKLLSAVLVISFNLMLGCASAPKASYEDDLLMTKVRRLVYDGNFEEARTALSRVRDSNRMIFYTQNYFGNTGGKTAIVVGFPLRILIEYITDIEAEHRRILSECKKSEADLERQLESEISCLRTSRLDRYGPLRRGEQSGGKYNYRTYEVLGFGGRTVCGIGRDKSCTPFGLTSSCAYSSIDLGATSLGGALGGAKGILCTVVHNQVTALKSKLVEVAASRNKAIKASRAAVKERRDALNSKYAPKFKALSRQFKANNCRALFWINIKQMTNTNTYEIAATSAKDIGDGPFHGDSRFNLAILTAAKTNFKTSGKTMEVVYAKRRANTKVTLRNGFPADVPLFVEDLTCSKIGSQVYQLRERKMNEG